MDVRYHRELNRTWMILSGDEAADHFAFRMMEENRLEHLLPVKEMPDGGESAFRLDITGGSSLAGKLEMRTLSYYELRMLMNGLACALEELQEYLIEVDHLLLDPELIYLMPDLAHLKFCCHPSVKRDFFVSLKELIQYCLNKTDHQDRRAAAAAYELFDVCSREFYRFEDLMEVVGKAGTKVPPNQTWEQDNENGGERNETEKDTATPVWESVTSSDSSSHRMAAGENGYVYRPAPRSEPDLSVREMFSESGKRKRLKRRKLLVSREIRPLLITGIPSAGLAVLILWRYWQGMPLDWRIPAAAFCLMLVGAAAAFSEWRQQRNEDFVREDMAQQSETTGRDYEKEEGSAKRDPHDRKTGRNERRNAERRKEEHGNRVMRKEEWCNDDQEQEGQKKRGKRNDPWKSDWQQDEAADMTEILSEVAGRLTAHRLQPIDSASGENGEKDLTADIFLRSGLVTVGKPEGGADAVIDLPAVSRHHAELEEHGGSFYLRDCHSTNGTCINGRRLTPNAWYPLKTGDTVTFANAKYRFV